MSASRLKTVFLAAASLTAATAASAYATELSPVEPVAIEHASAVIGHDAERPGSTVAAVKRTGLAAAATAALAGLVSLFGLKKIKAAGAATVAAVGRAATASVEMAASAGKAVAGAVASPFRFAALLGGIGVISLAGVGFFDVEWAGGLVFGAVMASMVIIGARRARRAIAVVRRGRH